MESKLSENLKSKLLNRYNTQYKIADETFLEWRRWNAKEKVHSIVELTKGMELKKVIDIGCGTGAVIEGLSALDFAQSYYAVDFSEEAIGIVNAIGIKNLRYALVSDAANIPYPDKFFDLAILSHILEHVHKPAFVLKEAARIARHVFVEVPLEDTPILNFTWILRAVIKRKARNDNIYGHIVYFSRKSIIQLCKELNLTVVKARGYLIGKYGMLFGKRGFWLVYAYLVYLASKLLGYRIFSRIYHSHYAMLLSENDAG